MELKKAINNTKARHKRLKEQLEKGCYYGEQYNIQQEIEEEETIIQALEKEQSKSLLYKQQYEKISNDFENYKKDKDINYLDGIHHKKLVEKSIGQIIDKPEECWFDSIEVKIIKDNKLYSTETTEDFISLKEISDKAPEECITVIAESSLSGAIYRYNNYHNKEWQLIGTMLGYA